MLTKEEMIGAMDTASYLFGSLVDSELFRIVRGNGINEMVEQDPSGLVRRAAQKVVDSNDEESVLAAAVSFVATVILVNTAAALTAANFEKSKKGDA